MRRRNKHKIVSTKNERLTKIIQEYARLKVQDISATEEKYYKCMCKNCKYNKYKCLKGLAPSECAKKGEKYK